MEIGDVTGLSDLLKSSLIYYIDMRYKHSTILRLTVLHNRAECIGIFKATDLEVKKNKAMLNSDEKTI